VSEKGKRFLIYFSKLFPIAGHYIKRNVESKDFWALIGFINLKEIEFVVNAYLRDEKEYINGGFTGGNSVGFRITPHGWAYLDSLKEINPDSNIGFVAMWIDKSLNEVYENAIKRGIEEAGYESLRIDYKQHNNRIDDEIIATIRQSKLLIADLTGDRGGVYFEAGYAMGLGLPVVWTCREDELKNVHFDTRQYYFITWEDGTLDEFKDKLKSRIEATIGRGTYKAGE